MKWTAELAALFTNTADGVWVSDSRGRIAFWNRAAETILGYPAQQVVGKACADIFGGCDSAGNRVCGWPCPVKMRAQSGEPVQHFHMATRSSRGEPLWIDVSCVSILSEGDEAPTIVHLFRDVTAAHQIELLVRRQLAQGAVAASEESVDLDGELTRRELQVVEMLRTGSTTEEIADKLAIRRTTVRNHVQNILSKLNVHTRLEAVAYVNQLAQRGAAAPLKVSTPTELRRDVARRPFPLASGSRQ
jgi:PAS domain S-box-containing protein